MDSQRLDEKLLHDHHILLPYESAILIARSKLARFTDLTANLLAQLTLRPI